MKQDKSSSGSRYFQEKLTNVHKHLVIYGHRLTEHATIIYSHSEIAMEGASGECLHLRAHLRDIHDSAREIGMLSIKIRELVSG